MAALANKIVTTANQWVEAIAIPASGLQYATISINLVNRESTVATISVAISTSASTPATGDLIEDGRQVDVSGGKYEFEHMVVNPGERVMVMSSNSNCVCRTYGIAKV